MAFLAKMLCRADSCGRAAALHVCVDKRPVAGACSEACAEQIRAQLIGMPKRAADDDDDGERDELVRVREERQRQKQRFLDFVTLSEWAAVLGKIRANVYTMTPLEVSTATMRIGARFDDGGATMAAMLDTLIHRVIEAQTNIVNGNEYDLRKIVARVRKLRDKIADETMIGEFDRLYLAAGERSQLATVPDGVRRLVAARANPIQKIAEFPVDYDAAKIWAHNGRIRVGRGEYAYDGTLIGDSPYQYAPGAQNGFATNPSGQTIVAVEPHGSWAIVPMRGGPFLFGAQNGLFLVESTDKIAHSSAPAKLYSFVMQPAAADVNGFYIFSAGKSIVGGITMYRYNDPEKLMRVLKMTIDDDAGVIFVDVALQGSGGMFKSSSIALDSLGNLWMSSYGEGIHVRDPSARNVIANFENILPVSICAAEDGVWIAHYASGRMYCTNYRLAPAAVYNRGLLSA